MATNAMANRVRVGGSLGVAAILGGLFFKFHERDAAPMPFAPESFPGVEVTTVGSTSARMTLTTVHMPSMCMNDLAPTWEHCTTSPVPSPSAAEAPAHVSAHARSSPDLTTCVLALMDLLFPWLEYFLLPSRYYEAVKAAREYLVPVFSVTRVLVDHYIQIKHSQLICFVLELLALWSCAAILFRWRGQALAHRDDQQRRIRELERQLAQATANAEAKRLALEDQKRCHAQKLDDLNLARQLQQAEWDWKVLGLTDELKDCAKQLDDLSKDCAKQLDDLSARHQREQEDRDQRELDKDNAHQRELSDLRGDAKQEIQELNERLVELEGINSASNRQHYKKNKTIQGLHDDLEQEKSRSESEKATLISDHEQEIAKLQKKLDEVNESIEEISKDHQEMEDERDQALKDLEKAAQGPKEQLQKAEDAWKEKLDKAEAASKAKLDELEQKSKAELRKLEQDSKAELKKLEQESKAKLERAEQESKTDLQKVDEKSKANLKKVYDDLLHDSAIFTRDGEFLNADQASEYFQEHCELPKCWKLVTYQEMCELDAALRTVYNDIEASLYPVNDQEEPSDAESWELFRATGKLPVCYTLVTLADLMTEREECFKIFSKSLKAQPDEKQRIQQHFQETGELPPQAEIAEGHLPQQAQPTLAMSTTHTAISVAPVDDTSANLAISTMQTVFSEAPVAHEVEDTEAHSAIPKMQILFPYMPVAHEVENTESDSHLQIPKPRHVSTTETVATAQNPFVRDAVSQKGMSTAQRFHFARTGGKIPAFGTIKFGAGQDKAFDFTKPTTHTFSDETEYRHGLLANRDEFKVSRPSVKTKRRTERASIRPSVKTKRRTERASVRPTMEDETGRTIKADEKRAQRGFNGAHGGFMNDAFQEQIAKFLTSEALAKEGPGTPEARAPEDRAPEDRALDDRAPEARAPEDRAPEARAPEDQAPEARAPEDRAPEDQAPEDQAPKVCYYEKGKPCQSADCVGDPEKYDENGCWIHEPGNETRRYGGNNPSNENNRRRRAKGKQLCCDCYKKSLEDKSS